LKSCLGGQAVWGELTEVVLTPQSSNFSNVGVAALGVSMNSNSLSEPLMLWDLAAMLGGGSARAMSLRQKLVDLKLRGWEWRCVFEEGERGKGGQSKGEL
jgi:hypothetical protein